MGRLIVVAVSGLIAAFALQGQAQAAQCHDLVPQNDTTYPYTDCVFHCPNGDFAVEHCLTLRYVTGYNCSSTYVSCQNECSWVWWQDWWEDTCLCIGFECPHTSWYKGPVEWCDICL